MLFLLHLQINFSWWLSQLDCLYEPLAGLLPTGHHTHARSPYTTLFFIRIYVLKHIRRVQKFPDQEDYKKKPHHIKQLSLCIMMVSLFCSLCSSVRHVFDQGAKFVRLSVTFSTHTFEPSMHSIYDILCVFGFLVDKKYAVCFHALWWDSNLFLVHSWHQIWFIENISKRDNMNPTFPGNHPFL